MSCLENKAVLSDKEVEKEIGSWKMNIPFYGLFQMPRSDENFCPGHFFAYQILSTMTVLAGVALIGKEIYEMLR